MEEVESRNGLGRKKIFRWENFFPTPENKQEKDFIVRIPGGGGEPPTQVCSDIPVFRRVGPK